MEEEIKAIPQDKKISFVVPVFHTEKYLKKCLESLLDQDYPNIEIICVADGKSKEAEKIVKKFGDKIKYVTVQHGGAPKARNEGYKHITGDYVSFFDSDCYAEPGMVRMWNKVFHLKPEIDFVYSGYRFNDQNQSVCSGEQFDTYLLTCNNYIATMFPMKREIFSGFDEKLKSLQDWDMWLTLTEKGYKGYYLEGTAFITEMREGISSDGCSKENWLERYKAVREKHNIKDRNICFTSIPYRDRAIDLAKLYKQDFLQMPSYHPHEYKIIYNIGFFPIYSQESSAAFQNLPEGCKKVIHWMGHDVQAFFHLSYIQLKTLVEILNKTIDYHFCDNNEALQMLKEIGIKAEYLPLPMKSEPITNPKEFKVICEHDNTYDELAKSIIKAVPNIKIDIPNVANINDYGCLLSLLNSSMPSEEIKRFCLAERYLISTARVLYGGYVAGGNPEKLKREVIDKLYQYRKKWNRGERNVDARKYYENLLNPDKMENVFKKILNGKS